MSVDSYLELFTTLFGWTFYGIVWDVLVATGIVYLPFLGILIDNWREPAVSAPVGAATAQSFRRMELDLFLALAVAVLAGQPAALTPLNATLLSYTPPPTLNGTSSAPATTSAPQSTYGTSGFTGAATTINLPVWWYAVLSFSSGFSHAVISGLPTTGDLRALEQQARLATITEPALRQEVSDFFSQCYVAARSKYQAERPTTVSGILNTFGASDPDWLGSHVYRTTRGYYDELRATVTVPGWAYDPARDTEYDPATPPAWGKPTCKQWWEDPGIGLRHKLTRAADATAVGLSGLIVAAAPLLASEQQQDAVARTVLNNAPPVWSNNDLVANNTTTTGLLSSVTGIAKEGLAAGGVVLASAFISITMTVLLQALPMIQALILLGLYSLLPFILVLSRYSISFLITAALGIFTVKFWTVLWYLAMWVDQNLIQSMYPDINILLQLFANPGEHDAKRLLLNLLTTALFLGLPLLWTGMMGWAGIHVGRSIDSAVSTISRPAQDAGEKGGTIVRRFLR